jgi:hypothetical protein
MSGLPKIRQLTIWGSLFLSLMLISLIPLRVRGQNAGLRIEALPSSDGHEVWLWANWLGEATPILSGEVCDTLCGDCQAMTCAPWGCQAALSCFSPETTVEDQLSLTLTRLPTQTITVGPLPFVRGFLPASQLASLISPDNRLELTVFPGSLPADTYILILSLLSLPGPLPPANHLVGQPYSIRPSGALVLSDQPMSLKLAYDALELGDAGPHNLSIYAWEPAGQTWVEKGGILFAEQNHLSIATSRFTTYALFDLPAWRDTFADASGLSTATNTTPTSKGGLILAGSVLSGTATSSAIIPTTTGAKWGRLVFTSTTSTTTEIIIDVLSLEGEVLQPHVANGESLAAIDPAAFPALKLRSTLFTTVPGESPILQEWRITWQPTLTRQLFLPLIMKRD